MVVKKPIRNYELGRGSDVCQAIVIHCTGYPANSAEGIWRYFNDPGSEKSSHDLILANGDIWEMVDTKNVSWGAGTVGFKNGVAVPPRNELIRKHWQRFGRINQVVHNIETHITEDKEPTTQQYNALAERVKQIATFWNIPLDGFHVLPHRDIRSDKSCPGKISVGKILDLVKTPSPILPPPKKPTPAYNNSSMPGWMVNLMQRYQNLGHIFNLDPLGGKRGSDWPAFRKLHIKKNCSCCGKKGTILKPLELHHLEPFNKNPARECDPTNVETFCRRCHQLIAHLDNFHSHNINAKEDAALWREKIDNRPVS